MTVEDYYVNGQSVPANETTPSDTSNKLLYFASVLCNDARIEQENKEIGDPTEVALLQMEPQMHIAISEIQTKYPRIDELPFDSDRKMMSTLHTCSKDDHSSDFFEKQILIVKGAVDVLLQRTDAIWTTNGTIPMNSDEKKRIQIQNQQYSEQGLRVLAFAYRELTVIDKLTFDPCRHPTGHDYRRPHCDSICHCQTNWNSDTGYKSM